MKTVVTLHLHRDRNKEIGTNIIVSDRTKVVYLQLPIFLKKAVPPCAKMARNTALARPITVPRILIKIAGNVANPISYIGTLAPNVHKVNMGTPTRT